MWNLLKNMCVKFTFHHRRVNTWQRKLLLFIVFFSVWQDSINEITNLQINFCLNWAGPAVRDDFQILSKKQTD